jgi:RNA-splicing ligase RtcB
MPDIHPGKVSTIGFTATVSNPYEKGIMPIIVGTDIGCGITAIKLEEKRFEFQKLDKELRVSYKPTAFRRLVVDPPNNTDYQHN